MIKLNTIQKREKLNDVYSVDEEGPGGAHHKYSIQHELFPVGEKTLVKVIGEIQLQKGPRNEEGSTTGVIDSDLLEIVRDRLKSFQAGPFSSNENQQALIHIEEALMWLNRRVEDRIERQVLGKNSK